MKLGLVAQRNNPRAATLADDIAGQLEADEITIVVDEATADHFENDGHLSGVPVVEMATCDLVVSIGGDGTFLFTARGAETTPIVGVNLGEVGFLNAVAPDEAVETVAELIARMRAGKDIRTHAMSRILASGDGWTVPAAVNEIAVLGPQRGHGNGIDITIDVDGDQFTSGHADGVLIATPTGSTAYNLSEGGPLVHPAVSGLIITKMAGTQAMPPLVVDEDSTIQVQIENASRAFVASDGRVGNELTPPATVTLQQANKPVHIAGPALDFFAGLEKLE